MGLLDSFGFDPNDPRKAALLQMGLGLLANRGPLPQALGQAGLMGVNAYHSAQGLNDRRAEEAQQREMRQMQIDAQRRQFDQEKQIGSLAQNAFGPNPNLVQNDDEGNAMPQAPGGGGMPEFARGLMSINPMAAVGLMQKQGPMKLGKDDRLVDPTTYKELVGAAPGEQWEDLGRDPKTGQHMQRNKVTGQLKAAGTMPQQVNVSTNMPPPEKSILKVDEERLGELSTAASQGRRVAQQARVINGLLKGAGGGGAVKLGAETARFLGIQSGTIAANDLVESLNTQLATQIRAPGSGATSNLEFEAYKAAVPSLKNSEEGRALMADALTKFAERNAKLADYGRTLIRSGKFSDEAIAAYDDKLGSVLGDDLKKKLGSQGASGASGGWSATRVR